MLSCSEHYTVNLITLPPDCHNSIRLWHRVFQQAIEDLDCKSQRLNACHWFISNSTTVGSFLWLCSIFNINPDAVRQHLKDKIYADYIKHLPTKKEGTTTARFASYSDLS